MTIALAGSGQGHPTAQFKLQISGQVLPGYCQSLDDPGSFRVVSRDVAGRDGGPHNQSGAANRTVSAQMLVLSRLGNSASGRAHLDDCIEQYRDALAIAARTTGNVELYLGDSDRYLTASFESWTAPMSAPQSRRLTYSLNFRTSSWYTSTTSSSASRATISDARIRATVSGTPTYAAARFSGENGVSFTTSGIHLSYPPTGNIEDQAGSVAMWLRPVYSGTSAATSHPFMRVSGSSAFWDAKWQHTNSRYVLSGSGSVGGSTNYATAPAVSFAADDNVFVGFTWNSVNTHIYAGVLSGSLVTSSSTTPLFDNVGLPTKLYFGATETQHANAVLSNIVIFDTALTAGQMAYLFSGSAAYDPFDTDLPTTMLLDLPLDDTTIANSSSNSLYMDIGNTRLTYPVITINGGTYIRASGTNTGKSVIYDATASPAVTIDCGNFTVIDSAGTNKVANIEDVNFGIAYSGSQRIGLEVLEVSGTVNSLGMVITPRYER